MDRWRRLQPGLECIGVIRFHVAPFAFFRTLRCPIVFSFPPSGCDEYKRRFCRVNAKRILRTLFEVAVCLAFLILAGTQLPNRQAIGDERISAFDQDDPVPPAELNALACTELKNEPEARSAFQRAIDINPDLHAAYNNLGYVLFKQGNYDKAIEMYNEALGRSPDNSSAHTNLGNAYFKLKRFSDAEDAWSKALELDPGNDRARKNLKRIREESK